MPEIAKEPIFEHHAMFNLGTVSMTGAIVSEKSIENVEISLPSLWYSDEIYNSKKRLQEHDTITIPAIVDTPLLFDRLQMESSSGECILEFSASMQSYEPNEKYDIARIPMSNSLLKRLRKIEEENSFTLKQDRAKVQALFKVAEVKLDLFRLDEGRGMIFYFN